MMVLVAVGHAAPVNSTSSGPFRGGSDLSADIGVILLDEGSSWLAEYGIIGLEGEGRVAVCGWFSTVTFGAGLVRGIQNAVDFWESLRGSFLTAPTARDWRGRCCSNVGGLEVLLRCGMGLRVVGRG